VEEGSSVTESASMAAEVGLNGEAATCVHATARRVAERSRKRCVFIVVEEV